MRWAIRPSGLGETAVQKSPRQRIGGLAAVSRGVLSLDLSQAYVAWYCRDATQPGIHLCMGPQGVAQVLAACRWAAALACAATAPPARPAAASRAASRTPTRCWPPAAPDSCPRGPRSVLRGRRQTSLGLHPGDMRSSWFMGGFRVSAQLEQTCVRTAAEQLAASSQL